MEPQELSPALLQPQVAVVAVLGELLAALPRKDEMLLVSPWCPCWHLERFAAELRATLSRAGGTCWHHGVTYSDGEAVTSLSQALGAYRSVARSSRKRATRAAIVWHRSVDGLADSWARLAREATELCRACGDAATRMDTGMDTGMDTRMDTKGATRMDTRMDTKGDTSTTKALQDKAARDGTAQVMVELGQDLGRHKSSKVVAGHEAEVGRDAMVAAKRAKRATKDRQQVEAALGLLEHLVAACDAATAFPRELQRRVGDIEAALKGTNEASPDVAEDLVAKVAEAERLWEANARLAKDHLLGTVDDIIKCYIDGDPTSPSACGVAERCQRAIEDIPRLLRPPECPQGVPKVSPVSKELQEVRRGGEGDRGDIGGERAVGDGGDTGGGGSFS
ncbi:uncharacterized protein LOC121352128 [Pyrgilauda ruficollis]|uniref:uncharacterized protein LOC121352128 n=1 Tax=Pyrgilauda ruficollis TaxID=221976 RepID=UPI001B8705D1|nr:uncharacterized protein LOC121352128 [Pyrgilauda ruficollis]